MHLGADLGRKLPVGLKAHSHEERRRIMTVLVPLIQRHMGKQLIALAATGSFALKCDESYSDLDFIGFVRDVQDPDRAVINLIYDGLLIHVWFLTRGQYLYTHKHKVGDEWAYAGANTLVPIINEPFIRALSDAPSDAEVAHYRAAILELWPFVQEATGKVMNAVISGNDDNLSLLYWHMIEKLTVVLALLNRKPFSTRSKIFSEARRFALLPKSFATLFLPLPQNDRKGLGERALTVFEETERLLDSHGLLPYAETLECFVKPLRFRDTIRRRLWSNALFHKTVHAADRLKKRLSEAH